MIYGSELGKKYNLNSPSLVIGRSSKCDIQIDQESISRNHSKIVNTGKSILVRDLGSTNGTYVNDEPIDEYVLRDGDLIKIGRTIFKFLTGGNIENAYHEEIYRLTTIDGLTQIFNKRYFLETLEREIARAHRYRRALSLVMFDIDHFKKVNDSYGHLAGDYVLKHLAQTVRREDPARGLLRALRRRGVRDRAARDRRRERLPFAEKIRQIVEKHGVQVREHAHPDDDLDGRRDDRRRARSTPPASSSAPTSVCTRRRPAAATASAPNRHDGCATSQGRLRVCGRTEVSRSVGDGFLGRS